MYCSRGMSIFIPFIMFQPKKRNNTDMLQVICWPASLFCGCNATKTGKEYVLLIFFLLRFKKNIDLLTYRSMLAFPVKINGQISNAIPI